MVEDGKDYEITTVIQGNGAHGSSFSDKTYYETHGDITALRLYEGTRLSG